LSNISLNTGQSVRDSRLLQDDTNDVVIPETIPEIPEETPQTN
jgi:hypothetical protein